MWKLSTAGTTSSMRFTSRLAWVGLGSELHSAAAHKQFQEAQQEVIIMPFILRPRLGAAHRHDICSCAVGDVESKRLKIFSSQPDRAPEAQPKRCCQGLLDEGTCTKDTSLADLIREAVCQCSHWSVFRSTER